VALGSAAPGVLDFHWRDVTLPEAQGGESPPPQPTRLLTGSGEIGLPAGLLLGVAELPTQSSAGRGHRLQLRDVGPPTAALRSLWVRVERGGRAAEVGP
jgi:hypothetical protein